VETIATMTSRHSRSANVHISKRRLMASLPLQPKSLHLQVGHPLLCWMRVDRYRRHPSTVRMVMVLHFMTTTATPGFPYPQKCPNLRAIQLGLSRPPSLQSFLHRRAIHKIQKTQRHLLLNHSRHHPRRRLSRNHGKPLNLQRLKRRGLFHRRLSWKLVL
jgi:hypothetical protein